MTSSLFRLCLFIFISFGILTSADAQDIGTFNDLEKDITLELMKKNVGELANELAKEPASNAIPLLRRLIVYSRAGHDVRLLQTIKQLANAPDFSPYLYGCPEIISTTISTTKPIDIDLLKAYNEKICPSQPQYVEELLFALEKQMDEKEIDEWLAAQATRFEDISKDYPNRWQIIRLEWRLKRGTAKSLLSEMEEDARKNLNDLTHILLYLRIVDLATNNTQIAVPPGRYLSDETPVWVGDEFNSIHAYDNYALGAFYAAAGLNPSDSAFRKEALNIAIKLFNRSLSLTFEERDKEMMLKRDFRGVSQFPHINNWDKQLRYWTKKKLLKCYQKLNQTMLAQSLVEELLEMERDGDDIQTDSSYYQAGAAQAGSGMHVIEQKILREEKEQSDTAAYWNKRISYYRGRGEEKTVLETYRQAIAHLPYKPDDKKNSSERLAILYSYAEYAEDKEPDKEWSELEQILRKEFYSTASDVDYSYNLIHIIHRGEFEALLDEIFTTKKDIFFRLFPSQFGWSNDDEQLIDYLVESEKLSPKRKEEMWQQLSAAVKHSSVDRKYTLAEWMIQHNAAKYAIPLLQECLAQLGEKDEYAGVYRDDVKDSLFEATAKSGNWRLAERTFNESKNGMNQWQVSQSLGLLAISAAKAGDLKDAIRFWGIKANINRRDLMGLDEMAKTKAKDVLREFYLQMKKSDPYSVMPDVALRLLM